MAYEKYIKKDGKLYGPYLYHSKRVDGKVISEYHGQKKLDSRKFLWILPLVALIILGAYIIGQTGNKTTGYSILGINANYQEGQPLEGNLVLLMKEGELIPAESTVVFENGETKYEYSMAEIVSEQAIEGDFFVSGKNLSGFGPGFGLAGTKEIFPEVNFVLLIYLRINETEDIESEREVLGSATKENSFTYELQVGERAELKPRSVKVSNTESTQLGDDAVNVDINGNEVFVTTSYSEIEDGFGAEYTGEKTANIIIDLNSLNLLLQPGELDVSIIYNLEELVSLKTTIGSGDFSGEAEIIPKTVPEEQSPEQIINDNITETVSEIPIQKLILTTKEKSILENEFGNISLYISEAKTKNGFLKVRYELGNFWIEYSYSLELSEETLVGFMEADRIKWLKDIAQGLSDNADSGEEISNFTGENFSF